MPVLVPAAGDVLKTHGRGTTQVEALPRVSLDIDEGDAVAGGKSAPASRPLMHLAIAFLAGTTPGGLRRPAGPNRVAP